MTASTQRQRNAIVGALVADAAAVGLHWLYDQQRVQELSGERPEFTNTKASDYDGYPGYFAHDAKNTGDFSQYGEQAMVMLQSLAANAGRYSKVHYEQLFRSTFGSGGRYVGYIDRPTRDTLDQIAHAEQQAIATAKAQPFSGTDDDKHRLITKVIANMQKHSGSALTTAIESAVRLTHNDDAMVAYALSLVDHLSSIAGYHGADDVQLPAVSKLPALIALYHESTELNIAVESAVRVTNNADLAVESGQLVSAMICNAITTGTIESALQAAVQKDTGTIAPLMQAAHKHSNNHSIEVVAEIGMSCNLEFGLPCALHILQHSSSYQQAIRTNILAGGDSCGRAIVIGAIAGAVYGTEGNNGIPAQWITKLNRLPEVDDLLNSLGLG